MLSQWIFNGFIIFIFLCVIFFDFRRKDAKNPRIQAKKLGWSDLGTVRETRDTKFAREGITAILRFKDDKVILINPPHPTPFNDFVALELFLQTGESQKNKTFPFGVNNPNHPLNHVIKKKD